MAKLTGKVAVVTGASKGIGAGIAKDLALHGATVVVNYSSSREGADKVVAGIEKAGGKAAAIGGSVAKQADVDALFAETKKRFGKVDILVNNAGVYSFAPIDQVTEESIDNMFNVNVKGLLLATKAAVALFPAEGGAVINIGSEVTSITPAMTSVYTGTKGALNAITQVLAKELGAKKIRVNAVNPGPVHTEGYQAMGNPGTPMEQAWIEQTPLGRVGQTDDIATVVSFLASDDAKWVTGSLIGAAGGLR